MHKDITHTLKQVGSDNGDKAHLGDMPNLKKGEYRYYPSDNSNLSPSPSQKISRKEFEELLKQYFPNYIISPIDKNVIEAEIENWIGSVGEM